MVIAATIIGILFTILVFIALIISDKKGEDFNLGASMVFIITFLAIIEVGIIANIIKTPQPTAMDVYQGKTILEYTTRDNVKIDSIVVFKDNIYGKEN